MSADKKKASVPKSDPCSSASIRGFSSILFRRGTRRTFTSLKIDKESLAGDPRYPFGIPRTDNGNYLLIQHFHSALNKKGRAGHVDVMVAIRPNFFFTVTQPCTIWFFDKGKSGSDRADKVLFIDARHIFRQLDRAHRDFTPAQIEFIAKLVRFYRGEDLEFEHGSEAKWAEVFESDSSLKTPN